MLITACTVKEERNEKLSGRRGNVKIKETSGEYCREI
jgi:hypothetical protein